MVTELAILNIDPAKAEEFEKTYQDVVHILRKQPGYLNDKLMRAIERPEEYVFLIEWGSVSDHERFIDSSEYPSLNDRLGDFVKDASIAHYITLFK
jgi:heme-degrading monooxygenase HmoA